MWWQLQKKKLQGKEEDCILKNVPSIGKSKVSWMINKDPMALLPVLKHFGINEEMCVQIPRGVGERGQTLINSSSDCSQIRNHMGEQELIHHLR